MKSWGVLFFLMSCWTGQVMSTNDKMIYGYVEKATLVDKNISLSAKLDTGAKSASLYAVDINEIEIDGVSFLRFTVPTAKGPVVFQSEFVGRVKIKARTGEASSEMQKHISIKRPIVLMKVKLGNEIRDIKVNLANRKRFIYPLLLGRDAIIAFDGIVDPSRKFTLSSPKSQSQP